MNRIKIRKNNNYTSILLQEISLEAFTEAKNKMLEIYQSGENAVIKPSKAAWKEFFRFHTLRLDDVGAGEAYKVLGTTYTVKRNLDKDRDDNDWYSILEYYDREKQMTEEFSPLSTDNFAEAVLETSFKNHTGLLMYF